MLDGDREFRGRRGERRMTGLMIMTPEIQQELLGATLLHTSSTLVNLVAVVATVAVVVMLAWGLRKGTPTGLRNPTPPVAPPKRLSELDKS